MNGKWLAQSASGTQRYASQIMASISRTPLVNDILLILPSDAVVPGWAENFPTVRSRFRGIVFEQIALPWLARGRHLYSLAGPAPLLKRNQTLVMHDAMPLRYPETFRPAFVAWYRIMYGLLSRTAKRIFTVSSFSRAELSDALGVSEQRFELAPCGADHIDVGVDESPAYRPPFPPHTFALMVGNLATHKNVGPVATALAEAGIPVAVVGAEQDRVFRRSVISESSNLKLLGRVDDAELQRLYADAGVLVASSRYEGFGIPIIEAGRLGCPTVFALGSALTEVAGDGGLGFDPGDNGECVKLVQDILADSSLRADLSARARANADRFSWDRSAATIFNDRTRVVRVLHVTETFAAGTGTAIIEYARATKNQGIESFLLAQDRGSGLLAEIIDSSPFVSAELVPPGLFKLWRALRRAAAAVRPEVIHLHSSLAGGIGRLQAFLPGRPAIVYTAHCFAFERRDISPIEKGFYHSAEAVLAHRTTAFICVGPHEAELARSFRSSAEVFNILNIFEARDVGALAASPEVIGCARVVTVGRVAPQKDPRMFVEIISALRRLRPVEATWIGNGEAQAQAVLTDNDVAVTGWLPAKEVPGAILGHTVYLHTGGWEASAPIAIFDAMNLGLPVVVRRNPAYRGVLPDEWQFDDVAAAVQMITALAEPAVRRTRIEAQFELLAKLRGRAPVAVLADIYRQIALAALTK